MTHLGRDDVTQIDAWYSMQKDPSIRYKECPVEIIMSASTMPRQNRHWPLPFFDRWKSKRVHDARPHPPPRLRPRARTSPGFLDDAVVRLRRR